MEAAQLVERVFDGVAAFDPEQHAELFGGVRCENVRRRQAERELVWMPGDLIEYCVKQRAGAARVGVRGMFGGVDPQGEELGGEVACAGGVEVQHAGAERSGEVPAVVEEALRGVGVAVDNDGGGVNAGGVGHTVVGHTVKDTRATRGVARPSTKER